MKKAVAAGRQGGEGRGLITGVEKEVVLRVARSYGRARESKSDSERVREVESKREKDGESMRERERERRGR